MASGKVTSPLRSHTRQAQQTAPGPLAGQQSGARGCEDMAFISVPRIRAIGIAGARFRSIRVRLRSCLLYYWSCSY